MGHESPSSDVLRLLTKVESLLLLTSAERRAILENVRVKTFQPQAKIIKRTDIVDELYFLTNGIVRSYYESDGRQINTEFIFEDSFFSAFTSYSTGAHTNLFFEALESATVVVIKKEFVEQLEKMNPKWYALSKIIFQLEFIKKCKRESSFLLHDATTRYLYFIDQYPEGATRLPLFHVASYLGINAETLSRIRSKQNPKIDVDQV